MRTTLKWARAAMAAVLCFATPLGELSAADMQGRNQGQAGNDSILRIPGNAAFPLTKQIELGVGRSLVVQFPVPLKDVLVSDPAVVDAVVQSSERVFLIAKGTGQTNAFFFDEYGQQILTLEVRIGADLSSLDQLLSRLIPGSNVRSEMAGRALVLTGSVRSPIDSNRAAEIASQFAASIEGVDSVVGSGQSTSVNSNTSLNVTGLSGNNPNSAYQRLSDNQSNSSSGGGQQPYEPRRIINLISVEGEEQVMLRVTVAEVQRTILKQFGINVGALVNSGNFSTALLGANGLPLSGAALGTLPTPGIATIGAAAGTLGLYNGGPVNAASLPFGNSGVAMGWASGNQAVNGALRAMERDGLLKTLAEPNLTAVSGEAAQFLAGGEYPIPVADNFGQVSVTFKKFGIGLAFTPVVLSEGRISLKIETEVSELSNEGAVVLSGLQIPALKTRQANSTVELPSGGSIAIAGLLSENTRQNIDGFPGLKDVPILGTLFRSRDYQRQETELVVIVTPYMVRPVARQELARPVDGLGDPTDRKANFLGHINRVYGGGRPAPAGDLKGDYGFIVE
ncbi:type II and III secretion system protein family protein [Hyphomicrobium sulfonivorans]|uniref:type II and III secretion system protein family protein n=1 Tax=Hyphomicrobium sulfonivorans TaxID=121290 RepID=UPI00156D5A01|nr:type II and III secretion system protein family protein [Hyphomicrobium sulfonivorans]MBI1649906.1 type II and III secretion system protein family protein [Hyphomicrobium sulfonivorans]NSL72824.1 type II and III secretion system protein [Hyphomicrobium sulfonivorans]